VGRYKWRRHSYHRKNTPVARPARRSPARHPARAGAEAQPMVDRRASCAAVPGPGIVPGRGLARSRELGILPRFLRGGPAGSAQCRRWKARRPRWRATVRRPVGRPLVLPAFRAPSARCSARATRSLAPLTAAARRRGPPKSPTADPLFSLREKIAPASGLRSVPVFSLRSKTGTSLRGSVAALPHPFQGVLAADFVVVSRGAQAPPKADRAR